MTNKEFIESIRLPNEEWRDVVGYEGIYKVSSIGRIIVLQRIVKRVNNHTLLTKPKIKKPSRLYTGYLSIGLTKNSVTTTRLIHRLVAVAFIENPEGYPYIDHIDGSRDNNCVSNLRWCTQSQNMLNPISRKRNSLSKKGKRPYWVFKKIVCIKDGVAVKEYNSISDVVNDGHSDECVSRVCRKLRKTYHGYRWMYLDEYKSLVVQ